MIGPVSRKLIAKELYINRLFIWFALIAGLLCLAVSWTSRIAFAIGGIGFITIVIAYAVVLAMVSIATERKEKSVVFVMSLPISRAQYMRAKSLGVLLSFLVPWTVLLVAAVAVIKATLIPDGMILLTVLFMGFVLADFCILVVALTYAKSELVMIPIVILVNISVTFFVTGVMNLTNVGPAAGRNVLVWDTTALTILGGEAALMAIAFLVFAWMNRRDPDIV